jgi:hypothetical protein
MKTVEILALRTLQGLSIALGTMVFIAIGYAIVQIAIGNYHSTASFEF